MRGQHWDRHQRLHASQARRQREKSHRLADRACILAGALDLKRDHAAAATHLLASNGVLRMALQKRVMHAPDFCMLPQEVCHAQCILVLSRHPNCQRLEPANQHPRGMRVHAVAKGRARLPNLIHEFLPPAHHAAGQVRVPAQILRAGVHDQVDAVLRRALVNRCAEGTVDHAEQLVLPGQGRGLLHINHAQ